MGNGKLQIQRSKNTSTVYTWLASMEPWSLQYCAATELPAKTLCPHVSTSHLDVAGEEGVAIAKNNKMEEHRKRKREVPNSNFSYHSFAKGWP